jgi:hypothetical protein
MNKLATALHLRGYEYDFNACIQYLPTVANNIVSAVAWR